MARPKADSSGRMTEIIVDTDVLSFLLKNHPIGRLYDADVAGRHAGISFMTVAELERWALLYKWSPQRVHWLRLYIARFTIVPSSPDLCRKWAEVMVAAQAAGRRIETADAWIAATALLHDVTLVTHNGSDFLGVPGLKLVYHGQ
jgi:predicted nucleic acid-binding protein